MNRLAIFVLYNADGIIYDYCKYIINELKSVCNDVIVICNNKMTSESIEKLKSLSVMFYERENKGYDAYAYKYALENCIGWNKICDYDELILTNDSYYGPFWALNDIVNDMNKRKNDFWGLTAQLPMSNTFGNAYIYDTIPFHIQSYFLFIRSGMLHDDCFRQFWDELEEINCFTDAVVNFELKFTSFFTNKKYIADSYVDYHYQENDIVDNRISNIIFEPGKMIKKFKCPILKRKCFTVNYSDVLQYSFGQETNDILKIISDETEYDTNMIIDHLIRTTEPSVLYHTLHHHFIIPSNIEINSQISHIYSQTAVIAHINYPELIRECFDYLCNIPKKIDVYITTKSLSVKNELINLFDSIQRSNVTVILIGDKGREIRGLLIECAYILKKYEFIGYVHDKRTVATASDPNIGKKYRDLLWDNMLKSEEYINNILSFMLENPHIGLLAPPEPYHWNYFRYLGQEWTSNFKNTRILAKKLKLKCIIDEKYPPFILGTTFWCRSKSLEPLINYGFSDNDFEDEPLPADGTINHSIERILQYSAQSQGFASGIILNDQFSTQYLMDYHSMINGILSEYRNSCGYSTLKECMKTGNQKMILDFCNKFDNIFIFGTGNYAGILTDILIYGKVNYNGYIVSDGHKKNDTWKGKKIYTISEVTDKNAAIILALNPQNQAEVIPLLRKRRFKNIYIM